MKQLVEYFHESSNEDFDIMLDLHKNKRFTYALFFGHLCLEKLLKSLYVKQNKDNPPQIHSLVKLALKCNLTFDDKRAEQLSVISTFCVEARYGDVKKEFYKLCTNDFTNRQIEIIKELRKWLKEKLTK